MKSNHQKITGTKKNNHTYKDPVKMYEIVISLDNIGKQYVVYAPSYASDNVIDSVNDIMKYFSKYHSIAFNIAREPM